MSGGGNRWSDRDFDDLFSFSQGQTQDKFNQTEVERFLSEKLKEFNDHDYEAISRHRDEIQDKLQSIYDTFEALLYGGSHSRYTDVSKLSDIDILAIIGDKTNLPSSSTEAIEQLARALQERFPRSDIHIGRVAATIRFSDGIEIQVIPTYKDGDGFLIPKPDNSQWVKTCPHKVAEQLTDLNSRLSGKLVPLIKLAKAICNAQNIDIKSYHLENIALKAFGSYVGQQSLGYMLRHLFSQGQVYSWQPMSDPCGQSADISADLSSSDRTKLAGGFNRIENRIDKALNSSSLDNWENLFK